MRFILICWFVLSLCGVAALAADETVTPKAQAAESKLPATRVYRLEVATVATQTLDPVFGPHADSVYGGITMKFRLDKGGHVSNLTVTSSALDRWVENTAKRVLQATKFPPIPAAVMKELGRDSIGIETVWIFRPSSTGPQVSTVTGAELFDYGVYDIVDTGKSVPTAGTATRTWDVTPYATLVKKTDVIHVRGKTDFGIRYRLTGKSGARPPEIRVQLVHPPLTNSKSRKPVSVESFKVYIGMGQLDYRGYMFEEPWQMVPGTWTFQLYAGKNLILEKPFQVIIDK